jgi:hypothetical protein
MDWIDQNLDAYRVIAEILTDLRPLVRERLEKAHGKEWFRDGIPEEIFERLIQNKEQEASIDWYENRYQEVISYAVFPDLFEIITANPGLFDPILKLAPSPSLLNTRFLELEVMRAKIGRAREVSEAEINFLTSFHLRFRRAIQELKGDASPVATSDQGTSTKQPTTGAGQPRAAAAAESSDAEGHDDLARDGGVGAEAETGASREPGRPPMRLASPSAAEAADDEEIQIEETEATSETESTDEPADTGAESADTDDEEKPKERETASAIVKRALENGDDQTVLRELYREVTGIAEVIWTTNEIPTTRIWDRVSTNPWYESSFSRLELRPLSDFYELISQVREKRRNGAVKGEIQSFLNDSKFATILLSLRDMFQKNHI